MAVQHTCAAIHGFACGNAIVAVGSSTVRIEGGATVTALDSGSPAAQAIVLAQGSSLLTQGATIQALDSAAATITAGENSVVALAGGNTICSVKSGACDSTTDGTALVIDHVSTLMQVPAAEFGYTAAQDLIFGNATAQLQSTIDLGSGSVGGQPSIAWTVQNASTGGIAVAQNSSFRLNGGVSISGTGGVRLSQGSNGFFNISSGGTNSVSGGITCPFTAIAGAHVVGQTAVTPNVALATSFLGATTPKCLPF